MAQGSNYLTTYYAKRIIGDTAAANSGNGLLQSGAIASDMWIFSQNNRTSEYGIKYVYDSTNGHDKVEFYGGNIVNNASTATAWVQLDTGDAVFNKVTADLEGIADYARLLYPQSSGTVCDESSWSVIPAGGVKVWGESFSNSTLKYINDGVESTITDSGHIIMWLQPDNGTSDFAMLCMRIDGTFQSSKFIGPLNGNADTATSLATAREIYVTLNTTRDTNNKVTFDGTEDKAIHVSGILAVTHGGTGVNTIEPHKILIGPSSGTTSDAPSWRVLEASDLPIETMRVYNRAYVGTTPNYDDPGFNGFFEIRSESEVTITGTRPFNSFAGILSMKTPDNIAIMQLAGSNTQGWWIRGKQSGNVTLTSVDWERIVVNSGTWDININGTAVALTSNAGGTEQPIYFTGGKPAATSYALKATVNNGDANYVAYYSGARAISSSKAATTMIMPAHYYHNLYNNNPTTGTTVYVHYYNNDTTSTNTFANLRVKSGTSYKVLAFGGDGALSWGGTITASGTIYANGGYLKSTLNNNTLQIGSANASWCHFSSGVKYHFNPDIWAVGGFHVTDTGGSDLGANYTKTECTVNNTNGKIGILSSTNRGLYEYTDEKWIVYLQHSDDTVRFGYNAYCYSSSVCSGNAASATKLATGRTLKVSLSSTAASTAFNGTANITDIGVGGTLGTGNGGTGNTEFTTTRMIYSESATKLSSADHIYVLNNYLISNSRNSTTVDIRANGLIIYGQTYGNTATDMLSNTKGVFRFSDGGPQIIFNTSASFNAQAGALIYTDNDSAATGASFHFVTTESSNDNGGNLTVTAPRFRARVGLAVGQNSDNTSYKLYVNGTSYFNGNTTHNGIDYFANGTTYYINNSANANLNNVYANSITGYNSAAFIASISGSPWPYIRFDTRAGGSTYVTTAQTGWCHLYAVVPAKRDTTYYKTRFFFRQYSKTANTTTRLDYYEDYYLPETNDGRTSNIGYNILTTKDMSFSITGNAATATKATQDSDGNTIKSTYLKLSGGTLTGAINTANNTWNSIGDDAQLGDINKAGHVGIQGKNGNTGLFFTTYNQTTKTTGGAITWDGTNFSITGTTATSISGNAATATTADNVVHTATGVSYINGAKGSHAAVYAKKATGAVWYPAVALQTSGGGAWQIGNYNDETLEFQYATKANIDSTTNSTSEIYMTAGDTGRVATSGNVGTGDNNGQVKIAGTNVSVKGLGSAAYTASTAYATSGHNHDSTYLKLSGGTMTGDITLNSSGVNIVQKLSDTSNFGQIITWQKATAYTQSYLPGIGFHNVGGTGNGSISILPFATNTSPWGGTEGLFITSNSLKFNNVDVVRNSGSWAINITGTAAKVADSAHSWTATEIYNYMTARVLKAGDTMTGCLQIKTNTNQGTDALLYIEQSNNNDWGIKVNKTTSYDYGIQVTCKSDGSHGIDVTGRITGTKIYGSVWNDYAECRNVNTEIAPGYVVYETESGTMEITNKRLQAGCKVVSDTYGMCIGETEEAKTPIAVCGRVLVYPYRNRDEYELGAALCSAPNGTVDVMTREEIIQYPERIIGTVSEIPNYETWLAGERDGNHIINVDGRIWIYVK